MRMQTPFATPDTNEETTPETEIAQDKQPAVTREELGRGLRVKSKVRAGNKRK